MAKHCTYHHNGECFAESNNPTDCDLMCKMFGLFANLEMAGYRLASDVAREIFEELETKAPWFCENQTAYEHFNEELAELKKKYTQEK
jgi:hypothetical protein